jgi:hypothetical protein
MCEAIEGAVMDHGTHDVECHSAERLTHHRPLDVGPLSELSDELTSRYRQIEVAGAFRTRPVRSSMIPSHRC